MPRADNYSGKPLQLSPRETEVLRWTACGKTSGEISNLLSITEDTVNAHIKNACLKLDAANKTHATAIALLHGVIRVGPLPELVIPLPTLLGLSRHSPNSRTASGVSSHVSHRHASKKVKGHHDG
jgi:DNA-binding CsgD family transcriptional regulator